MAKPKTRLVATKDGSDKELLSVRERTNGDLVILLRYATYAEFNGENIETLGQRYSIHRSPSSPGFTIKQTLSLQGGRQMDTAQFRTPGPDGFVALVFGKTVQDLVGKHYNLDAHKKDRIVRMYDDDLGSATLFYFLIVTEHDNYTIAATKLKPTIMTFKYFDIITLSGFIAAPPNSGSDSIHVGTSFPRFDPTQPPVRIDADVDFSSRSFQESIVWAEQLIPHLTELTINRMRKILEPGEDTEKIISDFREISHHTPAWPFTI